MKLDVIIHIIENRCKGCLICVECCQTDVFRISEDVNEHGYVFPVVDMPERCIACGLCEMFCPDFALWIEQKPVEASVT